MNARAIRGYRLSPQQKQLWKTVRREPAACGQVLLEASGALDAGRLRDALRRTVERHGILRTRFVAPEGASLPLQVVSDAPELVFGEREAASDDALGELLGDERRAALADPKAPPLRACLVRDGGQRGRLVLTLPPMCADLASLATLASDVWAAYDGAPAGEVVQYVQFSEWANEASDGDGAGATLDEIEGRDAATRHWRDVAAREREPRRLPFARRAAAEARFDPEQSALPAIEARVLEAAAGELSCSPASIAFASWTAMFARLTRERAFLAGFVATGREVEDLAGSVGPFSRRLPIVAATTSSTTFAQLAQDLERETAFAADWAETLDWERPRADAAVVFEYVEVPPRSAGPVARVVSACAWDEPFALRLSLVREDGVVRPFLAWDRGRFDAADVDRLGRYWRRLFDAALARPSSTLSELPLLDPLETRALTACEEAAFGSACVHEEFARRAAEAPERVAVVCEERTLTYGALDRRAEGLATALRARGIGPESCVALLLERSIELAVAVLGVLKAGGAYVPFEPGTPSARLETALEDAGVRVIVTTRALAGERWSEKVCVFAEDEHVPAPRPGASAAAAPENLAYVIYTSGSTGTPKGVAVEHRSLMHYVNAAGERLGLGPGLRYALVSTPAADLGHTMLFPALCLGGTLHLVTPERAASPDDFAEYMAAQRIDALKIVPSHLASLMSAARPERCLPARLLVLGGEAASAALVERVQALAPACRVYNHYGPTETTVGALCGPIENPAAIDLGRGLRGVRVCVLGPDLELLPSGVVGMICIGGLAPARGYLGRPDATARAYVPDPFSATPGARLYLTGDLGRRLDDGSFEFLGRVDGQVKLHGHRIELGEVAACLRDAVRADAVVLAREDDAGPRRLVGYVASRQPALPEAALRAALARRLPDYMIPSAFVWLPQFPLTSNGKLDRNALPAPGRAGRRAGHVGPRSAAEQALCSIWSQVLRVPEVGVEDDFFELGGDSILSIQIVARARQAGLHITTRQLFETPTIARLAAATPVAEAAPAPLVESAPTSVPLAPVQRRFFAAEATDPHHYTQAVLLQLVGAPAPALLRAAVEAVVTHHDQLRARFHQDEHGAWRQEIAPQAGPVFESVDLRDTSDAELRARIESDAAAWQTRFELGRGPLWRAVSFDCGARPSRLLLVAHHLVVDGVTWRVVLEDLERAYGQLARGEAVALGPKSASYAAWAARLEEYARSERVLAQADYWRAVAAPTQEPALRDRLLPRGASGRTASAVDHLEIEATRALLHELPRALRARVQDALASALARAAAGLGAPSLRVEFEGHGREEDVLGLDVSRTAGWFTAHYPVVLTGRTADRTGCLHEVRDRLRAVPDGGLGFGAWRHLRPDAAAEEPADVSFNYLGQLDHVLPESTLFAPAAEAAGPTRSPRAALRYPLVLTAYVGGGELRFTWTYDAAAEDAVAALRGAFRQELGALARLALDEQRVRYTPADFPLAGLSQAQLDALLQGRPGVEDVYPLTPMQQGMLFHSLLEGNGGAYVGQFACDLGGHVDLRAFEQAWRQVVERYAILRSSVAWEGLETPVQVVWRTVELPLQVVDWSGLDAAEQEARWTELVRESRDTGFDFARAPLMRLVVVRRGAERYRLLWMNHHLLHDGWSRPLLLQAFFACYRAALEGGRPALSPTRPYRDFIAWLARQDKPAAEAFWRQELAGFRAPTPLPMECAQAKRGGRVEPALIRTTLTAERTRTLSEAARRGGATLNTLVQCAWALLLARRSGRDDVVFGATVSGRPPELEGAEAMVGLFINTLPVRVRLRRDARLGAWLREVQNAQARARQFEFCPLVEIQSWSEVPRGAPLFESLVVFENYPVAHEVAEQGARFEVGGIQVSEPSNFQLGLVVVPGRELMLRVGYDRRRFDRGQIEALAAELPETIEALARDPERSLGSLLDETPAAADPLEELYEKSNLTRNQLLVWVDEKLKPEALVYNGAYFYTIRGALDPRCFTQAFGALVGASDAMRTVIREQDGVPWREVVPQVEGGFELIDATAWSDEEVAAWARSRVRVPYDLTRRLFDAVLLKRAPDRSTLYFSMHHIVSDGWAFSVGFRALEELYGRALDGRLDAGEAFVLPSFEEFAAAERAALASQDGRRARDYWQRKLSRPLPPPTFFGRPAFKPGASIQRHEVDLGIERTRRLKELARRPDVFHKGLDATLYNVFASALLAWLYRATGNGRLALGSPFHNRRTPEARDTIGLLMQVLFLHVELRPADSFLDVLHKVVAEMGEVLQHRQFTPGAVRGRAGSSCEVSLNYHNSSYPSFRGLPVDVDRIPSGTENDSIGIRVSDFGREGRLVMHFDLHCDVFSPAQQVEVVEQIVSVLDLFVDDPRRTLGSFGLVDARQQARVLAASRGAALPDAAPLVPELFEAHARAHPRQTAAILGEESLDYAGLRARARALGAALNALGVGPERAVAIFAERSIDVLAGVLGTWRAGGAYLPLDPAQPEARLRDMLADARPTVLLTQRRLVGQLPPDIGVPVVLFEDVAAVEGDDAPDRPIDPRSAAYWIYTSGSSGRPKGVVVSHAAYAEACRFWKQAYELNAPAVHLQLASFSFDVFAGDVARSLGCGGTLALCSQAVILDPPRLYAYMQAVGVECAEFVPAVFRSLAAYLEQSAQRLHFMRLLIVGSDVWSGGEYTRFRRLVAPPGRLVNSYGVTEATIDSTWYEACDGEPPAEATVPIGRPFPNVAVYVLDSSLHLVPPGTPGEICIGGGAVARGYNGDAGLTAARFVCDPLSDAPGARLYRTGDLGCWTAAGDLQYLGRMDAQIKVRGYRVEPGEVEAALRKHASVADVAVLLARDPDGEGRLTAFVVPAAGQRVDPRELRQALRSRVPEYMVPAAFALLERLPTTPNGKVDRKALAATSVVSQAAAEPYVAPRTDDEVRLARVWGEVLKREVGMNDNFFALGGHSLLATVLVSRVRAEFEVDLPLRAAFEAPTVGEQLALVDRLRAKAREEAAALEEALRFVEGLSDDEVQRTLGQDATTRREAQ